MIDKGAPLALVYPAEGTPSIPGGAGVVVDAPHPNAARLFAIYLFSRDGQQLLADMARIRSVHPAVKLPAGMRPLAEIKVMKADAAAQEKTTAEIKKRYAEYFGL
jgi:iron(III) transport system substrate-binding protein